MDACIISSVMDKNQDSTNLDSNNSKEQGQVPSTRVRHALAKGDMKYVSELLGRHHRLVLAADDLKRLISSRNRMSVPVSSLLNLPPKEGRYDKCSLFIDDKNVTLCRVIIEKMHTHLELDELDICIHLISQNTRSLGMLLCCDLRCKSKRNDTHAHTCQCRSWLALCGQFTAAIWSSEP